MHVAQTPRLPVKCFEGNLGEPDASLFLLRERPLVLIDLTAIATIRILRLEWLFTTRLFRFAVTQGTGKSPRHIAGRPQSVRETSQRAL